MSIAQERAVFSARKHAFEAAARQSAAFYLACGIDLAAALATAGAERHSFILRIGRILERERQKGARRHWSYDLNRHIALKHALDQLRAPPKKQKATPSGVALLR